MDIQQLHQCHYQNNFADDFLDNIDLFEEVELGEIDLSAYNAENIVENSDSDSGISVLNENTLNSNAPPNDASHAVVSDCVLTEAVGACMPQFRSDRLHDVPAPTDSILSTHVTKEGCEAPKPIKLVRVISKILNPSTTIDPMRKIIPVHSFKPPVSKASYVVAASAAPQLVNIMGTANINVPRERCLSVYSDSPNMDQNHITESSLQNPIGDDAILDKYDPVTHSDRSLELHLRDFCGTMFSSSNPTSLRQLQTSYSSSAASPSHIVTPNTHVFTRVGLERLRKKQERMIKNRHAASLSRLRKKEYLERLEMRYEQLKRENLHLWRQNEEWRVRCESLESSLNELQTQINDMSPEPVSSDPIRQSQHLVSDGSSVMSEAIRDERCNIAAMSSSPTPHLNKSSDFLSRQHSTDVLPPTREWSPAHKLIANPMFCNFTNAGARPEPDARSRSGLTSLSGVVSRHRPGYQLNTNRSKLLATTSLLGVFSLFALNCLLSPLNTVQLTNRAASFDQHVTAHGLPAVVHRSVGGRTLMSVPVTADSSYENSSHVGQSVSDANASIGAGCSKSDPVTFNRSFDESSHAWQSWVMQNNRVKLVPRGDSPSDFSIIREATVASSSSKPEFPHQSKQTKSNHPGRKTRPPGRPTFVRKASLSSDLAGKDSQHVGRSLQPFSAQPPWNWDDLLAAAGRRNDTVYLILPRLDSMYLHVADPIYEKLVTKITFIVPAYPALNGTKGYRNRVPHSPPTMLQVECDLRNVTLLHPLNTS